MQPTAVFDFFSQAGANIGTFFQQIAPAGASRTEAERRLRTVHAIWGYSDDMLKKVHAYADEKIAIYNSQEGHRVSKRELVMGDGCKLSGVELFHKDYDRYIVAFLGTQQYAEYSVDTRWWKLHQGTKSNVWVFNYRGTTHAAGVDPSEAAWVQDGMEIALKLMEEKNISARQVSLFGTSLGGNLALHVAAGLVDKQLSLNVIAERTFRDLSTTLKMMIPLIGHWVHHTFNWWILDAEAPIAKLTGKVIVVYHENDYYIHAAASIKTLLEEKKHPHLHYTVIKMEDEDKPWEEAPVIVRWFVESHCRPLNGKELARIAEAMDEQNKDTNNC